MDKPRAQAYGGQKLEEPQTLENEVLPTAPNTKQGNPEPTIWDSMDSLKQHPLLHMSLMITKENIGLCLSNNFKDLDSKGGSDHRRVLMSLPGKFKVGHSTEGSYAATDFNDGGGISVVFKDDFVQSSTAYFKLECAGEEFNQELIDELLGKQSILSYIAFFQEIIEHELGHLKYHLEGVKDGGKDDRNVRLDTPEKLRYAAGFQANTKIRLDNFPGDTFEKGKCRVLEVKYHGGDSKSSKLILRWAYLKKKPKDSADQYLQKHGAEAKGKDLLEHMNYPKARRCGGSKRKREDEDHSFNPPDDEPSTDKGGDGDRDGDADGDAGGDSKPSPSKRSGRPWIESVAHYLPIANAAYETTIEKEKPQYETSSDGKDPLQDILLDPSIDLPLKDCDVEVVTCDENRKEKTEFSPQDTIWVKIFVRNNSKEPIGIPIAPGRTFGRSGVKVLIEGAERGRTAYSLCKGLVIKPSDSYTFFRILAKPKDDYSVEYAALSPGRYKASVSGIRGGSISFLFSVADKSSDASKDQSLNPPDDEPSTDEGGDADGGSKPFSSPRTWLESVAYFLPIAMAAYETTVEKKEPQYETSSDWNDPLKSLDYVLLDPAMDLKLEQCGVQVVTCDEHRNEKTQFSTQDTIYVKFSIQNKSTESIGIPIAYGPSGGRFGMKVLIKDLEPGRTSNSHTTKGIEIKPFESYTFFRILTNPKKEHHIAYVTPPPGTYEAFVSGICGGSASCSFSVVSGERLDKRKREDEYCSGNPRDDRLPVCKGVDNDLEMPSSQQDMGTLLERLDKIDPNTTAANKKARSWIENAAHSLPVAMTETTIKKKQPQVETSSDWKDPLLQIGYKNQMNKQTFAQCDLQVMTCDEHRNAKTQFSAQENIYVKVCVKNNSKESVFIQIAPGSTFGRIGLNVQIEGVKEGRVSMHKARGLEIKPSTSYTLFRIFTKPKKDSSVEYETPSPGQYKAIVPWFSKYHGQIPSCSFSVVSSPNPSAN